METIESGPSKKFYLAILVMLISGALSFKAGIAWPVATIMSIIFLLFAVLIALALTSVQIDSNQIRLRFVLIGRTTFIKTSEIISIDEVVFPDLSTGANLNKKPGILSIIARDGKKISIAASTHSRFEEIRKYLETKFPELIRKGKLVSEA